MKVSFIIPVFNHWTLINTLLRGIFDHTRPDEIIVVDDCSTDQETRDGLDWWFLNYGVNVVRPIENLGFLKASNYGVSKATGDIVVLISSDVKIEDDLAEIVKGLVSENPRVFIGGKLYQYDTGWNTFDGEVYPYLEGWLLACTKEVWDELGGFDVRFAPHDFEDVDISTTAVSKGLALIPLNNPNIRHLGGMTIGYNDERQALTVRNKEKFREKWITQPVKQV